jgi:hypothetical protein
LSEQDGSPHSTGGGNLKVSRILPVSENYQAQDAFAAVYKVRVCSWNYSPYRLDQKD